MKLRRKPRDEPELNLIPLIDVVFMMLIFFIVSTTFNRNTQITIDLPTAESAPLKTDQRLVEISIDAQGQFFINRKQVTEPNVDNVKQALQRAAGKVTNPPLLISADGKAPHQAVITAMEAAGQLGFVHMTFATKPTASP